MEEKNIKIGIWEIHVRRLQLKGWTLLDSLRREMDDAVSRNDYTAYYKAVVKFIETASFSSNVDWDKISWFDVMEIFFEVASHNMPSKSFPIWNNKVKKEKVDPIPWDYTGRAWYFWLNLFARAYGWIEEVVEKLDVDTAIALYQEIVVDDQLAKEWDWGRTEMAYAYDKSTKSSRFVPLERPNWMLPIPTPPKKIKIRKDMLPVGNIIGEQNFDLRE